MTSHCVTCCCNPVNAAIITLVLALLMGIAINFPAHFEAGVTEAKYRALRDSAPLAGNEILAQIPVVSFNIRLDAFEKDPNNHFIKRLPRLVRFFNRVEPWLVGLQIRSQGNSCTYKAYCRHISRLWAMLAMGTEE